MTIAGDADEIELGFDTGTADSDNAVVAVRNVASKTKQTRDGEDPFKCNPEQSDDRRPEEDVEKPLQRLAGPSSFIGGLAESFIWQGFWPDLTRPTVYTRLSRFDVTTRLPRKFLRWHLFSRDERVSGQHIPQRLLSRLADADTQSCKDFSCLKFIGTDPQA